MTFAGTSPQLYFTPLAKSLLRSTIVPGSEASEAAALTATVAARSATSTRPEILIIPPVHRRPVRGRCRVPQVEKAAATRGGADAMTASSGTQQADRRARTARGVSAETR